MYTSQGYPEQTNSSEELGKIKFVHFFNHLLPTFRHLHSQQIICKTIKIIGIHPDAPLRESAGLLPIFR
ncbi:MAG: hypothetical protein MGG37_22415 [Trichodesmium sp. MAG_R01]|nr:hypothetical protein [Trichodesmium sp. MAG_R01]